MANNPKVYDSGKLFIVDPNPENNGMVNTEDLNIIVELETINKERSAIHLTNTSIGHIDTKSANNLRVNFIDGSKFGNEKSLTTHYTEIGSPYGVDNKDLETFGITSIDIEFNSSYAPLIKINFTDVRARMFEQGNNSPYNVFFTLPYPVFKLKVKGYYGKAVTYCLHLLKFNAEFDAQTGNFNIVGEFIGYTYALLSDMLIGYLKAIPETSFGQDLIKEKLLKNSANDEEFITLWELTERVKKLNSEISGIKNSDDDVKEIAKNNESKLTLEKIKNEISSVFTRLSSDDKGYNGNDGYVYFRNPSSDDDKRVIKGEIDNLQITLDTIINNFNNETSDSLRIDKNLFKIIRYDSQKQYFKNTSYTGNNTSIKNNQELINDLSSLLSRNTNIGSNQDISILNLKKGMDFIVKYLKDIEETNRRLNNRVSSEIEDKITAVFGFTPSVKNFIKILTSHVELLLESIKKVSSIAEDNKDIRLSKVLLLDNNSFPDIPDNSQIYAFPEYTKENSDGVYEDAWLGKDFEPDVFPEIKLVEELLAGLIASKKKDNELGASLTNEEEKWYAVNPFDTSLFGKTINPWEEVKNGSSTDVFRLLLLRAITFLTHTNTNLSDNEVKAMAKLEANNAFKKIENQNVKDVINVYGRDPNKKGKANNDVSNILETLLTETINKDLSTIGTTQTTASGYKKPIFANGQKEYNGDGMLKEFSFESWYKDEVKYYEYNYISHTQNLNQSSDERKFFIPLSYPFDGSNIIGKYNADRIKLRDDDGVIFMSNYIGANSSDVSEREDDGATYVKFIDYEKTYLGSVYNLPTGNDEILKDIPNEIISKESINSKSTTAYNSLRTKFGVSEFITYKDGGIEKPTQLLFYENNPNNYSEETRVMFAHRIKKDDTIKSSKYDIPLNYKSTTKVPNFINSDYFDLISKRGKATVNDLLDPTTINIPYLNYLSSIENRFGSELMSQTQLFGSHFYYEQTDKVRALLFLNTLPYNGLISSNSDNKGLFVKKEVVGLFNKRGGFINAPKAWVLFLGAILWRKKQSSDPIKYKFNYSGINGDFSLIKGINSDDLVTPTRGQYVISSHFGFKRLGNYPEIDDIILKLPEQVKNEFVKEFEEWVTSSNGWPSIKERGEIFKEGTIPNQIMNFWRSFDETNVINNLNNPILKPTLVEDYIIFAKDNVIKELGIEDDINVSSISTILSSFKNEDKIFSPFNFFLEIRDNSILNTSVLNLMTEPITIVNSTWRIWADDKLDKWYWPDERLETQNIPFRVQRNKMDTYIKSFLTEFIRLNADGKSKNTNSNEEILKQLFGTINSDDIKISIYKNLKSIYDKWVCGTDDIISFCGTTNYDKTRRLIDSFRFIDRAFNDISDKFKVNPIDIINNMNNNYNQSFYDYIGTLLRDNNFDFIPLPTYIDYNSREAVQEVFETYTYGENTNSEGPQFICMYIGERNNKLNMEGSEFKDTGVNFDPNNPNIPKDFITGNVTPVFLINYSTQNQSIFKDLKLNQSEFSETQESLWVTDKISQQGSPTNRTGVGQNLYQLYLTRSYSCQVQAMGNAQIQPFMYFQLNNVPMFRGGYNIIKVSHNIVPHHMTTTFTGVRIKHSTTPLVKSDSLYMSLLGSLDDINTANSNGENSELSVTRGGLPEFSNLITYQIGETTGIKYQVPSVKNNAFVLKEIKEIIEEIGHKFHEKAKDKTHGDTLYIYDFSKKYGEVIIGEKGKPAHKSHREGIDGDVRPPLKTKTTKQITINSPEYSREGTRMLIETIIEVSKSKGVPIDKIYFNDTVLVNEFPGILQKVDGHDNHMHIRWTLPKSVTEAIKRGDFITDDNFDAGSLKKLSETERRKNKAYLGKI